MTQAQLHVRNFVVHWMHLMQSSWDTSRIIPLDANTLISEDNALISCETHELYGWKRVCIEAAQCEALLAASLTIGSKAPVPEMDWYVCMENIFVGMHAKNRY